MSGPVVEIDLAAIERNARAIVALCAPLGIEVMGVTKGIFGHPEVAAAMVRGGVSSIGDSRLDNVARLRDHGVAAPVALLRAPSLRQLDQVIGRVDLGLHTELATLELLATTALAAGRIHHAMLMVDLGDRREGVLPGDLPELARTVAEMAGIELVGIGTNLTCLTGLEPTAETMDTLVDLAEQVERETGCRLRWISGGSSSALRLIAAGAMPARVNQVRVGEAILLGRETVHHEPWPGTVQDAIVLRAEVLEVRDKPPAPDGPRGQPAFVRAPAVPARGGRRALVALGRADVDVEGLTPCEAGHRIVGASSDYLVVDVTAAPRSPAVGDELSFVPDYGALVTAAAARGVATRVRHGGSGRPAAP